MALTDAENGRLLAVEKVASRVTLLGIIGLVLLGGLGGVAWWVLGQTSTISELKTSVTHLDNEVKHLRDIVEKKLMPVEAKMSVHEGIIKDFKSGTLTLADKKERAFVVSKTTEVLIDDVSATPQDLTRKIGFPATVFTLTEDSQDAVRVEVQGKK